MPNQMSGHFEAKPEGSAAFDQERLTGCDRVSRVTHRADSACGCSRPEMVLAYPALSGGMHEAMRVHRRPAKPNHPRDPPRCLARCSEMTLKNFDRSLR
jgi:hypothetical protein